jgi:hypothetical protein
MASFYLLEDGTSKLLLEDGSGLLIEEIDVSLAATEGSDIAAFAAERDVAGSFALAATEGSDTAALISTVNARLQVTEAGDDASARVNVNASLSATEGSDIVAFRVNVNASLAANEGIGKCDSLVCGNRVFRYRSVCRYRQCSHRRYRGIGRG